MCVYFFIIDENPLKIQQNRPIRNKNQHYQGDIMFIFTRIHYIINLWENNQKSFKIFNLIKNKD